MFTLAFSKGKPNLLFYLNVATLFIKIPLVYGVAQYWGVTGIAMAFLTATFLNMVLNMVIVKLLIGDFLRTFLLNLAQPVLFCLLIVGAIAIALYQTFIGRRWWTRSPR